MSLFDRFGGKDDPVVRRLVDAESRMRQSHFNLGYMTAVEDFAEVIEAAKEVAERVPTIARPLPEALERLKARLCPHTNTVRDETGAHEKCVDCGDVFPFSASVAQSSPAEYGDGEMTVTLSPSEAENSNRDSGSES